MVDYTLEAAEAHYDAEMAAACAIIEEFRTHSGEPGYRQRWNLIPAPRLASIWNDYMRLGFVRDLRGLDRIEAIILENIAKLEVNTILCGHTAIGAQEYAEEVLGASLPAGLFDQHDGSFFADERGSLRISDYALRELSEAALRLRLAASPEDKLQIIDLVLNIVHARSDLASWFVEGGRRALTHLFGKAIHSPISG